MSKIDENLGNESLNFVHDNEAKFFDTPTK